MNFKKPFPSTNIDYTYEELMTIITKEYRGLLIACTFLKAKGVDIEDWDTELINSEKELERVDLKGIDRKTIGLHFHDKISEPDPSSPSFKIIDAIHLHFFQK